MKIKNSFVTNSSSTSFIVSFLKKLTKKDLDYIKNILQLPDDKAKIVLSNSLYQTPIRIPINKDIEKILYEICGMSMVHEDYVNYNDFTPEELREFIRENRGSYIYQYEFSDNDGKIFSELEHNGTFDKLPHLSYSKH